MRGEYVVVDLETGLTLEGQPDDPLASVSRGEAWQPPNDRGRWHLRSRGDPPWARYRLVQVFGGPNLDPNWYENTVENLDTSEG
ncbi:MAG TPA: hypothetical protein VFW20_08425 [Candidatus Limnocylindrales bacterium]|nr:hypothetical protein [Candidatus Limnocylindrales bacterium]